MKIAFYGYATVRDTYKPVPKTVSSKYNKQ